MKAVDVTILRPVEMGTDSMNEPIVELREEAKPVRVITSPGSSAELDATRPDGVRVSWTLHFPKTYTNSLRACRVKLFGIVYRVIGDPQPYMPENTPGMWNRPVEVEAVDG